MSSRNFYTNQFGVIHRRRILECIIIASEAINYLERTNNGHNMIVKDDIEKASNTVFRDFILDVIRCFGFLKLSGLDFNYRSIFHDCYSSQWLPLWVFKYFIGVRQEDPLSSLLVYLVLAWYFGKIYIYLM